MKRLPRVWLGVLVVLLLVVLATPALAGEAKGKIKSIDADKNQLVLADNDGKNWTFQLAKDAKLVIRDKTGTLADLKAGDEIAVTYEKREDKLIATSIRSAQK